MALKRPATRQKKAAHRQDELPAPLASVVTTNTTEEQTDFDPVGSPTGQVVEVELPESVILDDTLGTTASVRAGAPARKVPLAASVPERQPGNDQVKPRLSSSINVHGVESRGGGNEPSDLPRPINLRDLGTALIRVSQEPVSLRLTTPVVPSCSNTTPSSRPLTLPEAESERPTFYALFLKPILVEPLLADEGEDSDWREWQATRQSAANQARQAERENLARTVQDWLRR
jgi:hypothetical protein